MHTTQSTSQGADRFERAAAGAGLLSVVLLIVGFVVLAGGETPLLTDSVAKTTDYFSAGPSDVKWVGEGIEVLSFLVFIPFVAAVTTAIRTRGGETLGMTAFGAGMLYAGMSLTPGIGALLAAWYRAGHGFGGQTAIALNDLRDMTFYLSLGVLSVFLFATAAAILRFGIVARAYGWTAAAIAALALAAPVAQIASPLFLLWTAAFSVALVRRMAPASRGAATTGARAAALAD